ncbi:hypothetical protein BH20ACT5_BH20ACT5_12660 [soil metagenome]
MAVLTGHDVLLILLGMLVLFGPGWLLARAAGLSHWTCAAIAPLVTYGIAAAVGPLSSRLGVDWTMFTLLGATVLLAGGCLAIRRMGRKPDPATIPRSPDRRGDLVILAGVLTGALLGGVVLLLGTGGLQNVHQDWDATFHANAIRFIIDTGDADPGSLAAINNYELDFFFYPNAYHALIALTGQLSGASVPALINTHLLALPGIAGLGLAALIRAQHGRVALAATVPLLLPAFTGFSYDLLWRGPLLPYAAGLAAVPAFLLLFTDTVAQRRPTLIVVTGVAAVGLLGLHPGAAMTAAILALPLLAFRWLHRPARAPGEAATTVAVAILAGVVGLQFVQGALSGGGTGAEIDIPAEQGPGPALLKVFLLQHGRTGPQYWLVALFVVGLVGLARIRQLWWVLCGTAIFVFLFVAAASADAEWTETLTQPWWNDSWRLLAVAVFGLAVLAGHGVVLIADTLTGRWLRIRAGPAGPVVTGGAALAVLALVGGFSGGFYAAANVDRMSTAYSDGPHVSTDEQEAMRTLAELVGPDRMVMNDPGDGSAWMYALTGVRPVYGHVVNHAAGAGLGRDQRLLLSSFRCLDSDPAVRALVTEYGIDWVFTGRGYVRDTFRRAPGLRALGGVSSLDLVYDEEGIRIYRVDLTADPSAQTGTSPRCP